MSIFDDTTRRLRGYYVRYPYQRRVGWLHKSFLEAFIVGCSPNKQVRWFEVVELSESEIFGEETYIVGRFFPYSINEDKKGVFILPIKIT